MSEHSGGWHRAMSAFRSRLEELTCEYERVEAEGERLRTERDNSQMELSMLRAALRDVNGDKAAAPLPIDALQQVRRPSLPPAVLPGRPDEANGDTWNLALNMPQADATALEDFLTSDDKGQAVAADDYGLSVKPEHRKVSIEVQAPGSSSSFFGIEPSDTVPPASYEVSLPFALNGLDDNVRLLAEKNGPAPEQSSTWVAWGGQTSYNPWGFTKKTEDLEAGLFEHLFDDSFRSSKTQNAMEQRCAGPSRLLKKSKTVGFGVGSRRVPGLSDLFQRTSHPPHEKKLRRAHISMQDWTLGTSQGQWLVLGVIGALLVNFGALLWKLFCGNEDYDTTWRTSYWIAWSLFIDPGTQTGIPPSDPWHIHLIVVLLSSCGFLFNLSFLGMIVEIVKSSLARWRKERHRIVRTGHVLILGWTDKTLFLLTETLEKAVQQGTEIVILAERDEIEMKQDINSHFFNRPELSRHVIGRRGCPFEVDDLVRVSAGSARDIIVLDRHGSNSDLEIVRVMVALAALPEEISGKVTSEVRKMEAAPVIEAVLRGAVGVRARGAVGRVLCFMTMRPMIADCFINLCSFRKAEEITVRHAPSVAGQSFGELCHIFQRATLIGLKPLGSDIVLAPPDDTIVEESDSLVLIAHDPKRSRRRVDGVHSPLTQQTTLFGRLVRQAFRLHQSRLAEEASKCTSHMAIIEAMNGIAGASRLTLVVIGWPIDFIDILLMLDRVVPVQTSIHILSEKPVLARESSLAGTSLDNIDLVHHVGERTSVRKLASLPLWEACTIIILSEDVNSWSAFTAASTESPGATAVLESTDEQAADSAITRDSICLAVMVTVHGIFQGRFGHRCVRGGHGRIICEVLDPRTDQLLARNKALQQQATFFRSNALEAGMFARAATEPISYTALMLLLAPGNPSGELTAQPCIHLLAARNSFIDHNCADDVVGDDNGMSFWDVNNRIREKDGGILVGFWRYPIVSGNGPLDDHREGRTMLSPIMNRDKKLLWRAGDWLLIVTRRNAPQKPAARQSAGLHVPGTVMENEDAEDLQEEQGFGPLMSNESVL